VAQAARARARRAPGNGTRPPRPAVDRVACYAVPGHLARIRIEVWSRAAGLDPSLDLALALPDRAAI
jgi:hypothetical protein